MPAPVFLMSITQPSHQNSWLVSISKDTLLGWTISLRTNDRAKRISTAGRREMEGAHEGKSMAGAATQAQSSWSQWETWPSAILCHPFPRAQLLDPDPGLGFATHRQPLTASKGHTHTKHHSEVSLAPNTVLLHGAPDQICERLLEKESKPSGPATSWERAGLIVLQQ
jgi:hypothetical protein